MNEECPRAPVERIVGRLLLGCQQCKANAPIRHLHNTAHGIEGTHMDGSERFECSACGYTLTRMEANARGLQYVLDVEAKHVA